MVPPLPNATRRPSSSQGWRRGTFTETGRKLSLKECLISSGGRGHKASPPGDATHGLRNLSALDEAGGEENEPSWLQLPVQKVQAASEVVTNQLKGGPYGLGPDSCQNCAARLKVWASAIDRIVDKYRLTDLLSLESDLKQARIENRVLEKAFTRVQEEMVAYKSVAEGVWASETDVRERTQRLEDRESWLSKQLEEEKSKTSRLIVKLFDAEQHGTDLQREVHQLQTQLELLMKRTRSKDSADPHLSVKSGVEQETWSEMPPVDESLYASEGLFIPASEGRSRDKDKEELTASAICQWIDKRSAELVTQVSQMEFDVARKLQEELDIVALKAKYAVASSHDVLKLSETAQTNPSMWGISLQQLTNFRDDIEEDLTRYSTDHELLRRPDGQLRHVCLQRPCRCDHAEAVYVAKASVAKADQSKMTRLKPDMHLVSKRYLGSASEGWALQRNPGGLLAELFVCHSWNATFLRLVAALEKVLPPEAKLWIAAFALPPDVRDHPLRAGAAGAQAIFSSPVFEALTSIKTCLAVLDDQLLLPTRAWCSLEIVVASSMPGHKVVPLISDHLDLKLCQSRMEKQDIRNMKISNPKDLPVLLEACAQQLGSLDRCHDILRDFWAGALKGYEQILEHKADIVTRLEELEDSSTDKAGVQQELEENRKLFLDYLAAAQRDALPSFSATWVLGRPLADRRPSLTLSDADQQLERALERLDPPLALLVRDCVQRKLEQATAATSATTAAAAAAMLHNHGHGATASSLSPPLDSNSRRPSRQ